MQMDDMILVSIDDHLIEPPDMYKNHVPGQVARRGAQGRPQRRRASTSGCSRGQATSTPFGMAATVGWPREQWGFNPGAYSELRPGCFDVHERVRDMNANGVLASMNFPTMAGFNARTFTEARDKELALVMLQAYNDWLIDEWCAAYPGPLHPARHRPDVGRRPRGGGDPPDRQEGLPVDQLPRDPARRRASRASCRATGTRCSRRSSTRTWCCRLHIGAGFERHQARARGADRPPDGARRARSAPSPRRTCCSGRRCGSSPTCRVALSEGGIGWIPFYLDRVDRHFENQSWLHHNDDFGGKLPSEVFREHILACYITDPSGLRAPRPRSASTSSPGSATTRTPTRRGPSRPSSRGRSSQDAGCTDEEIHKITWENACRFFGWDPFAHIPEGAGHGRRAPCPGHRRRHHAHAA